MIDILFVISVLSVLQHVSIYDNRITIPDKSESIYVVNGFPPFVLQRETMFATAQCFSVY